jgi:hypothetical protein
LDTEGDVNKAWETVRENSVACFANAWTIEARSLETKEERVSRAHS